jgi:cell division septation protein DedD
MRPDPQAFHANGLAVWDGSRTLQGVWIAHPMALVARRVRLTNRETGVQVDAAMFRRDANLTGPQLIVSSEAARLLGLKVGHGTPIAIDGLAYRTGIEAASTAANAVDQVNPAVIEGTVIEPAQSQIVPTSLDTPVQPAAASAIPKMASEANSISTTTKPEPMEVVANAVAGMEPDPVLPVQTDGNVAIATGNETAQTPDVEIPQAVNGPPPNQTVNPTATEPDGSGDITDGRYFVQAGVFSQAENATRLVGTLRAAGLPANELPITLGTRQFMRVLVGPYQTVAKRNAALETVRRIGPSDATTSRG